MQEGEIMRESHSLNFTDSQGNVKNTYKDYHLIAKGKPSINPPEVQTEYVEILGRNGLLDMTGGVDGKVYFKNMQAEWSFIVDPRFDYYNVFHRLLRDLHGKKFDIVLAEDDPYATYVGRLTVSQPALGEHFNEVTISANIDPNYTRTADNDENGVETTPFIPIVPPDPQIAVDDSKITILNQYPWYVRFDSYAAKIEDIPHPTYPDSTYHLCYIPVKPIEGVSNETITNPDVYSVRVYDGTNGPWDAGAYGTGGRMNGIYPPILEGADSVFNGEYLTLRYLTSKAVSVGDTINLSINI